MWPLERTEGKKLMADDARHTYHDLNSLLRVLCAQVS